MIIGMSYFWSFKSAGNLLQCIETVAKNRPQRKYIILVLCADFIARMTFTGDMGTLYDYLTLEKFSFSKEDYGFLLATRYVSCYHMLSLFGSRLVKVWLQCSCTLVCQSQVSPWQPCQMTPVSRRTLKERLCPWEKPGYWWWSNFHRLLHYDVRNLVRWKFNCFNLGKGAKFTTLWLKSTLSSTFYKLRHIFTRRDGH